MCEPAGKKTEPVQQSVAGESDRKTAKSALKNAKEHLTDQLKGRAQKVSSAIDPAQQTTLIQEVAEIHAAIEAIDKTIAGGWSGPSTAIVISAASVTIAALVAILNGIIFYLNQDYQRAVKKTDAAISWCSNFYLPTFVSFQSQARQLADSKSPYRLPNNATIAQADAPTRESADAVIDKLKSAESAKATLSTNQAAEVDSYQSLLVLLNYIDAGALMVRNGDMDRERFANCFEPIATSYMERFDHSYIGLKSALLSSKNKDGSLQTAEDGFPFIVCVFKGKCDREKMEGH